MRQDETPPTLEVQFSKGESEDIYVLSIPWTSPFRITQDVWIEFITLDTLKWEFYKNADPDKLVINYIESKQLKS